MVEINAPSGLQPQQAATQVSQLSRIRAAAGDGNLSAETLAAIQNGAIAPDIILAADANAEAARSAQATQINQPLRDAANSARDNEPLEVIDTVELSPEAQVAVATSPAAPAQETPNDISDAPTEQEVAEQAGSDAATVALGNTVDVNT